jgi:hypothetical protein
MEVSGKLHTQERFWPREKRPLISIQEETGRHQKLSGCSGEEKFILLLPIKPRFLDRPGPNIFTIPTEPSGLSRVFIVDFIESVHELILAVLKNCKLFSCFHRLRTHTTFCRVTFNKQGIYKGPKFNEILQTFVKNELVGLNTEKYLLELKAMGVIAKLVFRMK